MYRTMTPWFLLLLLLIVMLLPASGFALFGFSQHKTVVDTGGEIHIELATVDDGKAHFFSYRLNGTPIKFFVVKSPDGLVRAAFDACDVCFPAKKGYHQDGDFMICDNCNRKFHTNRINVEQGGCNPAPLIRREAGRELVIRVDDLRAGARFF